MDCLWKKALLSAAKRAVQAAIAYLGQANVVAYLASIGVDVSIYDPVLTTAATYGALEFLRSWLKVKVGLKFL